jgi:hypothetical protein
VKLPARAVREAVESLSHGGRIWFSPRNLFYALVRRDVLEPPGSLPREHLIAFRRALEEHQRAHGHLPMMVSARVARAVTFAGAPPDVFGYTVRRVLVFDRLETMLVFAKNGFHLRVEVGLLGPDGFPSHVAQILSAQVSARTRTGLFRVHDASSTGHARTLRATRPFAAEGSSAMVADLGLSLAHCADLGITVRERGHAPSGPIDEAAMLRAGHYAHLEELGPIEMMRFVQERMAAGATDPGFG